MENKPWFALPAAEVAETLQVDPQRGLSTREVEDRRQKYGINALKEKPPRSILSMFIDQLKETLILILIAAAVVSGALGEWIDSIVILVIVILNAVLGVVQENKAEQALQALKEMTKATVKVLREGQVSQVNVEELVPGDIVLLEAGDAIPADARLLEAASFMVNEAALTGESVPVEKDVPVLEKSEVPIAERHNMIFMGTYATGGRAKAVVTGTGMNTELGKIAQMLDEGAPDPTPLQQQLARLGKTLGKAAGAIVVVVFLTGLLRGGELLEMFMTAVALAVAAIPEGLPAVVTIVLALGVTRMSKRNAVIRRLPAVETLGVATYICSDKTGTLTKNEMTTTDIYLPSGTFQVTGTGYDPQGDFLTEAGETFDPAANRDLQLLLLGAALNTDARLVRKEKGYQIIGDPTEGALVVAAAKAGLDKGTAESRFPRLAEIPFDSGRKMMTTFHKLSEEGVYSFTKGAPDVLLARCAGIHQEGRARVMSEEERNLLLEINSQYASQGKRVLAMAYRQWEDISEPMTPEAVEQGLTFLGYFVMIDPARPEAKAAVAVSHNAGIQTVMITGDHKDTALAIARDLGIWQEGDHCLTGVELAKLSDEELQDIVLHTTVYARVSPEDKLRIVDALKAKGQVVAMTGDGVNDAPALKRADIGCAMGITGTEVSKEASDMVLLDDNFATIVNAVEEGRTIYNNIRKAIYYLLSCNVGEIVAIFGAILVGLGSPLTPVQILWMNLVTDGLPALALGVEPPEKDIMNRPPRDSREGVFAGGVGLKIIIQGMLMGLLALSAYWLALSWGRSLVEAHTMAFLTMSLSQLVHSFNARSLDHSLFYLGVATNRHLVYAFTVSLLLQLAVMFVPFLSSVFGTTVLNAHDWAVVLGLSILPLLVVEIWKAFTHPKAAPQHN